MITAAAVACVVTTADWLRSRSRKGIGDACEQRIRVKPALSESLETCYPFVL
jgi:hypothetical protein